jgi:hypothetical protein
LLSVSFNDIIQEFQRAPIRILGAMASQIRSLLLITANVLIPIAILTFAGGFFPYKPFLSGLAQYESLEYGAPPEAPFDKVIFMVVDALRRYNGPF